MQEPPTNSGTWRQDKGSGVEDEREALPRRPRVVLMVSEHARPVREFPIAGELIRIGRHPSAHVVLEDPAVSGHHAQISRRGGFFVLEDVGSSNGTFLNGRRIAPSRPVRLHDGDLIGLGSSELCFRQRPTRGRDPATDKATVDALDAAEPEGPRARAPPFCLFRLAGIEATLVVWERNGVPRRVVLESDAVKIGRRPDSDVPLTDPSVSRDHAEIVYNREGFYLVDRDSAAGTFLDGVSVRVHRLRHRSFVAFGKQEALFLIHEPDTAPPEVSFELRDHLMEIHPEREILIQRAFRESRAHALDFAGELVLRGVLDPRSWWEGTRSFRKRDRRHGRGFCLRLKRLLSTRRRP